ncbi:MAG: hypothetical protein JXB49_34640 [Bacteroidales bacterium]|nr:hypothetical protein [Bacteroidales bacterium]
MKQRQEILSGILNNYYEAGNNPGNSIFSNDLKKGGLTNEVYRIWKKLDGQDDLYPLEFGSWDIILEKFILELDEEQHFNRYIGIPLESFAYHVSNGFEISDYTKYCVTKEQDCLKKSSWGKYWTSPSSEQQCGRTRINGDLNGNGSPRWRLRAFYGYLRDLFAMIYRIPLICVSIIDKIIANGQVISIVTILLDSNNSDLSELTKFIAQKVNKIC